MPPENPTPIIGALYFEDGTKLCDLAEPLPEFVSTSSPDDDDFCPSCHFPDHLEGTLTLTKQSVKRFCKMYEAYANRIKRAIRRQKRAKERERHRRLKEGRTDVR